MPGRSLEERIAANAKRIEQLTAVNENLRVRVSQQERKARTRRLIQIGGIMARLGIETLEQAQRLQRWAEANPRRLAQLQAIANDTGLDSLLLPDAPQNAPDEA